MLFYSAIATEFGSRLHKPLRLVLQVRHQIVFCMTVHNIFNQLHINVDWPNLIPKN